MLREMKREFLDGFGGILPGENVNGILDGVGGKNGAIVAGGVGRVEGAFETRGNGEVFDFMKTAAMHDAQEANARFAVIVVCEFDVHRPLRKEMNHAPEAGRSAISS